MKKTILVALLGATFLYAENSAFDAGNLANDSSYGLTRNEKLFKEKIDKLSNDYIQINAKINEINERVEGLQSTLEGINSQYSKSNSRLSQLEQENIDNNLSKEIQSLKAYVEESRKIQETNHNQIKKVLTELSSLVDSINANYVSKEELQDNNHSKKTNSAVKNDLNEDENLTEKSTEQKINTEEKIDETWKKKKNNEILALGIENLNKNAFTQAEEQFNHLIKNQYKPARAHFYLGEIEYKQKNYNNAISFYKKSSAISTKGDYFPKLLYHTAISLDKIGDTKSANGFYKALKTNYPNSPEAKASPNRK